MERFKHSCKVFRRQCKSEAPVQIRASAYHARPAKASNTDNAYLRLLRPNAEE